MERETKVLKINDNIEVTHYVTPVKGDQRQIEALMSKTLGKTSVESLDAVEIDMSRLDTIELGNLQLTRFIKEVKIGDKILKSDKEIIDFYDNLPVTDTVELDTLIQSYFGNTEKKT